MQDIHTHLYWESYDSDRDAVMARAHAAGINQLFTVGCTVEESRQCVALAEQYPEIFASVGIHPHFFNELVEKEFSINSQVFNDAIQKLIAELRVLAQNKKVVAIGECGLDYFAHETNNNQQKTMSDEQKAVQKAGFLAQITLAQELKLPLIVHCRASVSTQDAYEDLFHILREANEANKLTKLPAILHCYMGDTEITKQFLTLPNVYFSFTGNITYPVKKVFVGTKDDLTETVKMIPLERIFAETDCPFLAPQSHRGERNEPAFVAMVVDALALIQGVSQETVKQAVEENYRKIFLPVVL